MDLWGCGYLASEALPEASNLVFQTKENPIPEGNLLYCPPPRMILMQIPLGFSSRLAPRQAIRLALGTLHNHVDDRDSLGLTVLVHSHTP